MYKIHRKIKSENKPKKVSSKIYPELIINNNTNTPKNSNNTPKPNFTINSNSVPTINPTYACNYNSNTTQILNNDEGYGHYIYIE